MTMSQQTADAIASSENMSTEIASAETTPQIMAAELADLHAERNNLFGRYDRAGVAHRATLAVTMSESYAREAALWEGIHIAGRGLGFDLQELLFAGAAAALLLATQRSKVWRDTAAAHERDAQRIAERAARAFDSGMEYVPGRGVVRTSSSTARVDGSELACDADAADV